MHAQQNQRRMTINTEHREAIERFKKEQQKVGELKFRLRERRKVAGEYNQQFNKLAAAREKVRTLAQSYKDISLKMRQSQRLTNNNNNNCRTHLLSTAQLNRDLSRVDVDLMGAKSRVMHLKKALKSYEEKSMDGRTIEQIEEEMNLIKERIDLLTKR